MLKTAIAILYVFSAGLLCGCATSSKTAYEEKTEYDHITGQEQKIALEQTVTVSSPVKNIPITVSYLGGVFYHVQVNNTLPIAINLAWDESTYVTTSGASVRILHVPNKNDLPQYPPAQQVSSAIPPNSQFQADFTGEDWLDCARRNCKPQPKNSVRNARIYLAFNIKGKRVRWQGEVSFAPPR